MGKGDGGHPARARRVLSAGFGKEVFAQKIAGLCEYAHRASLIFMAFIAHAQLCARESGDA